MKRILCLLCALVLAASLLAACVKSDPGPLPTPESASSTEPSSNSNAPRSSPSEGLSIAGEVGRKSRLILDAIYESAGDAGQWVDVIE